MANPEDSASGSLAPLDDHDHTILIAGSRSNPQSTRLTSALIDQTAKLAGQAGHQVNRLMTEQKNRAADGLHRLACALRDTTPNLRQNDVGGQIPTYANRAAARMDSTATYLRGADFPTMFRDAARFARRPEVLVVGTIVTGLLVARFLKVSRRDAPKSWRSGRWHEALQKGAQVLSSAPETLREGARARGVRAAAVVENITSPRLGKHISVIGDRLVDRIRLQKAKRVVKRALRKTA